MLGPWSGAFQHLLETAEWYETQSFVPPIVMMTGAWAWAYAAGQPELLWITVVSSYVAWYLA